MALKTTKNDLRPQKKTLKSPNDPNTLEISKMTKTTPKITKTIKILLKPLERSKYLENLSNNPNLDQNNENTHE